MDGIPGEKVGGESVGPGRSAPNPSHRRCRLVDGIKAPRDVKPPAETTMSDTSGLILVTDETFDHEVIRSALPVVVDFYADWCAPCKTVEPILLELSASLSGKIKFTKINVDDSDRVTRSFGIHSIPTYLFVDHGREKGREVGPVGPIEFRSILKRHFSFA
jgi:thioredoxin 1